MNTRRWTTGSSCSAAKCRAYASWPHLATAYGDCATASGSPKSGSSIEPASTTRGRPASAAATMRCTAASRFARSIGSTSARSRLPPTSLARCRTTSGCTRRTRSRTAASSVRSACSQRRPPSASRGARETPWTTAPACRARRHTRAPMNPVAPVTSRRRPDSDVSGSAGNVRRRVRNDRPQPLRVYRPLWWATPSDRQTLGGLLRVLVTGHHGYIGSVLVPLAQRAGRDVVGLDSDLFAPCVFGTAPAEVDLLRKDVRDVAVSDLDGFDAVLHLAAVCNDPVGDLSAQTTYDINQIASA